ncbi:MAG: GNAT family N-acetyltransferase [Acidimicrobiales bacterium]
MSELRWVPPRRADDAEWADLLASIEAVDQRGETLEPADLADEWASVWSHPETDAIFVWDGPLLVAFGWLKTQVGERKEHRVDCWGGVRPSHRGRGIGRQLLEWQVSRASEVAATLDPALGTRIGIEAADHQHAVLHLAQRAGFEPVRRFLELARPTAVPVPPVPAVADLELVPWSEDLDDRARQAHADSFVDHWGSEPRTAEEWRQWYTGHRAFRDDLSVLALDPLSAEVIGFVLTAAYPQDWATVPVEAWITTVGTRRSWRGKGVARWLMAVTLERIAASPTGFERAILGVDADNPTGALRLYRALSFEDERAVTFLGRAPSS